MQSGLAPISSTTHEPVAVGKTGASAGRSTPRSLSEAKKRGHHGRAGVAGGDKGVRLAGLDQVNADRHRILRLAMARLEGQVLTLLIHVQHFGACTMLIGSPRASVHRAPA